MIYEHQINWANACNNNLDECTNRLVPNASHESFYYAFLLCLYPDRDQIRKCVHHTTMKFKITDNTCILLLMYVLCLRFISLFQLSSLLLSIFLLYFIFICYSCCSFLCHGCAINFLYFAHSRNNLNCF